MAEALHKAVSRRFEEMERRRGVFPDHWQDVIDYILPARTPVTRAAVTGEKRTTKQYDGTAGRFLDRLASTLVGLMMSNSERWFSLKAEGAEDEQTSLWLDDSAEKLYEAFHGSNFYAEAPESIVDLLGMGTACLFVDEKPIQREGFNGFVFRNVPIAEFFIDENDQGEVDTWGRKLDFTVRQAALKFGRDALHEDVQKALADEGRTDEKLEILHLVYRAGDPAIEEGRRRSGDRSFRGMPWRSIYVDKKHEHLIDLGGFRDQRYFSPRWSRSSGEIYGRGPAMKALPDVKTLNTIMRYGLEGLALDVYPPWMFPEESVVGRLRLIPGAFNLYSPVKDGKIESLRGGGNFQVEQIKEQDLRQAIAAHFLDDVLGLREAADVTATEILERRDRRRQVTGPAVARLETELLKPLVETCWKMMFRSGAFGRPPETLMRAEALNVEFQGPLSRAQRLGTVRALQDAMAVLGPILQVFPAGLDNYNLDAITREVPVEFGAPRKWLVDERAVAQTRQQRAQQQQAQAALAQGTEIAKAASEIGKNDAEAAA